MIKIGEYNRLKFVRTTSVGLFLSDEENNDVLLPKKYIPENVKEGDYLEVFVYKDSEDRPVATTLNPKIQLNKFAFLKAVQVNQVGAFMDWGLEKHLFVPFREQSLKMETGKNYIVYMYLDEKTQRLVASSMVNKFLSNASLSVKEKEEVEVMIWKRSDLGTNVIVNHRHRGLIYDNVMFNKVKPGELFKGYIQKIRNDNNLDIQLQLPGYQNIEPNAEKILQLLKINDGFLSLTDKTDPEIIYKRLEMSKKTFKKACGLLYKKNKIKINEAGIYLVK